MPCVVGAAALPLCDASNQTPTTKLAGGWIRDISGNDSTRVDAAGKRVVELRINHGFGRGLADLVCCRKDGRDAQKCPSFHEGLAPMVPKGVKRKGLALFLQRGALPAREALKRFLEQVLEPFGDDDVVITQLFVDERLTHCIVLLGLHENERLLRKLATSRFRCCQQCLATRVELGPLQQALPQALDVVPTNLQQENGFRAFHWTQGFRGM
mmetsp:Transcript_74881/g.229132  ORF Transcript_74881/g.229132 Transcript_74881/m.229132 type:complete len:212 (+) Transcript_74881:256-891(+)